MCTDPQSGKVPLPLIIIQLRSNLTCIRGTFRPEEARRNEQRDSPGMGGVCPGRCLACRTLQQDRLKRATCPGRQETAIIDFGDKFFVVIQTNDRAQVMDSCVSPASPR